MISCPPSDLFISAQSDYKCELPHEHAAERQAEPPRRVLERRRPALLGTDLWELLPSFLHRRGSGPESSAKTITIWSASRARCGLSATATCRRLRDARSDRRCVLSDLAVCPSWVEPYFELYYDC